MNDLFTIKEDIHKMNGIIGKLGFALDEIVELAENEEKIYPELLKEIPQLFEEMRATWKTMVSKK